MTPQDYARVREVFERAMAVPPAERRAFVDRNVPTTDPLRSEVMAMVEAGDSSSTFLAPTWVNGALGQVRLPDDDVPSQIGPYKIVRRLGKGGMGVVFMAQRNDDVFHKVVALKVIGADIGASEPSLVQRFKQERQILAGLDHPNIARILDGGDMPDGRPYFVMEYVDGSPIDDYCARMNTDVAARVRMMAQVCDAIEYLHKNAIAHRDIKPQNILVDSNGHVKLVDFGIAKVQTVGGLLRSASPGAEPTMIMTPSYASPEQIAGDASGKSGDIYSVAVVLYQLLTGRLPHAGQDGRPDLDARLAGTPPEPPSKEITKTSRPVANQLQLKRVSFPDLDRVVLTALQRDPLQRYGSVQLFGEDLRCCLEGRPISARPHTVTYTTRKAIGRNPVVSIVAAAALVVALGGAWLAVSARFERVELQAKEEQLAQFVSMLGAKVATWPNGASSASEKVDDMREANALLVSDTVRVLSERAPDPQRVKQLLGELRDVLDRADSVSIEEPSLRKEIALVYRRIGDVESRAPLPVLVDKQLAARSYRRAAVIAADLRVSDSNWANSQITELSGILNGLGAPLESSVAQPPSAPVELPPAPDTPPPAAARASARPSPRPQASAVADERPEVDPSALADVEQRLRATTSDAERARRNFESLRTNLASRGQTIRGDVEGILTEVDGLIEEARGLIDRRDLPNAEDYLRRASYQLKRVFQTVGG